MKRTAGLLVTGLGLAALLSGCTSAHANDPTTPTAASSLIASSAAASTPIVSANPTAAAPSIASVAPTAQMSEASAVRTGPRAREGQRGDAVLQLDVRETGGGLGSRQDLIVFRNSGSTSCRPAGAPGVSFVGGGTGTQLGEPAGRGPGAVEATTLQPEEAVTAELNYVYVDGRTTTFRTDDGLVACKPAHGDGYRI